MKIGKVLWSNTSKYVLGIIVLALGLFSLSLQSYLLFHSIAEGFSVVVAFSMFAVAWHTRKYSENNFLLFLGVAFVAVACLDTLHILTYEGMSVFSSDDADVTTQFWVAARFLQSISLVIAPLFLTRKFRLGWGMLIYFVTISFLVVSIFFWKVFPHCFIQPEGLTHFKKISEYLIVVILSVAVYSMIKYRKLFELDTYRLLLVSIGVTIISEVCFTLYQEPYSVVNMIGHYFKIIAFFLIYRAIIVGALEKPYGFLFNNQRLINLRLRSSEEHFRKLFALSGVGKAEANPQTGNFLRVNQRLTDITGYAEEELLHMSYIDVTHPEDREKDKQTIESVLRGETSSWTTEKRYIRKDGGVIWVAVYGTVMRNSSGAVMYTMTDIIDITERRNAQEQLMISERRYALAQRAANIGSWEWHIPSGEIQWSEQIEPMFGMTSGSFDGQYETFIDCIHPADRKHFVDAVAESLKTGKDFNVQHRITRPGGMERWMQESALVFSGSENDTPERMIGIVADVTHLNSVKQKLEEKVYQISEEKHEAEEKLKQRQEALEAVYTILTSFGTSLRSICDEVVESIAGILKLKQVSFCRITDGTITMNSRFSNGVVLHEIAHTIPCSVCKSTLSTGQTFQYSGDLTKKYNDCNCFKINELQSHISVPIINYEGDRIGILCAARREELGFQEYEEHLIEIFARYIAFEITRRQLEEKMVQSREMHLLGLLTSGVAHEVRNPLNSLMAITDALFRKIEHKELYEQYITHIRNQIRRLSRLMEDLLALGRPLQEDDYTRTEMFSFLQETIIVWQSIAPERKERIIFERLAGKEEIFVTVDRDKIQQVLTNVLDNAEQNLPSDGIIRVSVDISDYSMVRILCRDTGCGIAEQHLEKIFEPFFTTRKSGTGLGLSIVKKTIEHHRGMITIFNNNPPPGVTVEIKLPLSREKNRKEHKV